MYVLMDNHKYNINTKFLKRNSIRTHLRFVTASEVTHECTDAIKAIASAQNRELRKSAETKM